MKPIIVQDQVRLGPARCLHLALTGMGYRMFRSAITVSILALAVAFLVHVLVHSLLSHQVTFKAWQELADQRAVGQWVNRLTTPDIALRAIDHLAAGHADRLAEYRAWTGADEQQLEQARDDARMLLELDAYLNNQAATTRIVLTGDRDSLSLTRSLADEHQYQLFMGRIKQLSLNMPLGDEARLRELVRVAVPRLSAFLHELAQGHRQAIARVRQALAGQAPLTALAQPAPGLEQILTSAGFVAAPGALERLSLLARADHDREHLARLIQPREVRDMLARRIGTPVALVNQNVVLDWLRNIERANWLAAVIKDKTGDQQLEPARMLELAELSRRTQRLQHAVGDVVPQEAGGLLALPSATLWLIGLSFLVCVVGVANAMLMSVTERFTEIATMKCLGAMDSFVMLMFLFEAMLQGFFGGLVGVALGLLLAVLRALAEYGGLVSSAMDLATQLLVGAGLSLVAGVFLAAVAAVWPAWVASRLAPMEAMRVE